MNRDTSRPWPASPTVDEPSTVARPLYRWKDVLCEALTHATVYRALAGQLRPKGLRRADRSEPRKIARTELERYFEIVAALKVRTSNLKRRRLSTANCIALLETHGVETADGLVRAGELRLMQIGATDRAGIATK